MLAVPENLRPSHPSPVCLGLHDCSPPSRISCRENHFKTYVVQKSLPAQEPNCKQSALGIDTLTPWPFTYSFNIENESKLTMFSHIQRLRKFATKKSSLKEV